MNEDKHEEWARKFSLRKTQDEVDSYRGTLEITSFEDAGCIMSNAWRMRWEIVLKNTTNEQIMERIAARKKIKETQHERTN